MNSGLLNALSILRQKTAGVRDVLKAIQSGATHAGEQLSSAGHPTLGGVVKLLPAAGAVYAGKKALDTDVGQSLVNKYRMWKYQKAMEQAQQGY